MHIQNTHYEPVEKLLRLLIKIQLCVVVGVVFGGECNASESPLADLYQNFLATGDASVFVAFERETIIPTKQVGQQEIKLTDGRTVQINLWDKDYFAFYRSGSNFMIAYSSKAPITEEDGLKSADELDGFDGNSYWTLGLNRPITFHLGSTNNSDLPASLSFNPLTIIPRTEALRAQGQFQSDIKLAKIKGLLTECLSVSQFGYLQPLDSAPARTGNQLKFAGIGKPTMVAEATDNLKHPTMLDYGDVTNGAKLQVLLDYSGNSLTVQRSSNDKVFFQTRYRILATQSPCAHEDPSFFSWRQYKEEAGNVIGMLMTNGATVEAVFSNDSTAFKPGNVMDKPISTNRNGSGKVKRWGFFLLLMIASFGGLTLIWLANKSNPETKKQKTK